jgi:hypothetical protein
MGTVVLALVCVVLALALSAVLVSMELKRRKNGKLDRMWARLNGIDPDDEDSQQWLQDYRMKLHSSPRPGIFSRIRELLWGDWGD